MNLGNQFVFSPEYRWIRHLTYWFIHVLCFSYLFKVPDQSYLHMLMLSTIWVPGFILYGYPIAYYLVPNYLMKEKYLQFGLIIICWAVGGYFLNYIYRTMVLFPFSDLVKYKTTNRNPWAANSYLSMNVMAGFTSMIVLFKHWMQKQKDLLIAKNEQVNAELQLLKAQIHPHFLFNTLNNIYAFSMERSPQTPQLILKLSSILSYMLYDCRATLVPLEKEIEVMNNYMDLEKERYGERIEISKNITGDIAQYQVAPLLMIPFLENAFKHGTSEDLEKPWMSIDIDVKNGTLWCKIVNSKSDSPKPATSGIGIENVKKRLKLLYPETHELNMQDESDFYSVALSLKLDTGAELKRSQLINPEKIAL
ncbi:MAG TPA: histidine kinase [Chitinophagaceae bacterium]|nr:histidine kinase [Chitinophagaceae bacterium]